MKANPTPEYLIWNIVVLASRLDPIREQRVQIHSETLPGIRLTMSPPTEANVYCTAPVPSWSTAPPLDKVQLVATWQSGLETLSGLRQRKLRLRLASSTMGAPFPARL
jgi:hypothetical protein